MNARSPADVDRLFAEALNAGNLDALVALYEPQASLMPSPGKLVAGTAAISEALAGFAASKPTMTISPRLVSQSGDLAVVAAKWQLTMTVATASR